MRTREDTVVVEELEKERRARHEPPLQADKHSREGFRRQQMRKGVAQAKGRPKMTPDAPLDGAHVGEEELHTLRDGILLRPLKGGV